MRLITIKYFNRLTALVGVIPVELHQHFSTDVDTCRVGCVSSHTQMIGLIVKDQLTCHKLAPQLDVTVHFLHTN